MKLTNDNYFSKEAMNHYMSASQFKAFEQCEVRALAELQGDYSIEKDVYKEGHYFEAAITGNEELFVLQNSDMVSSRGATRGELKSNYKRVIGSVEAFKRQPFFDLLLKDCQKQVIVVGEIAGKPFKGCIDFLNPYTLDIYDTKCMKDFRKVYSENEQMYVYWYFAYGYNYQLAIYRELVRQNYGSVGQQGILAVTKEEVPDVMALSFTEEILDEAFGIINERAPRYDLIKKGLSKPKPCGKCDYCKQIKILTKFEIVSGYE